MNDPSIRYRSRSLAARRGFFICTAEIPSKSRRNGSRPTNIRQRTAPGAFFPRQAVAAETICPRIQSVSKTPFLHVLKALLRVFRALEAIFEKSAFSPKHVNLPFALFINTSINSILRFFPDKRGRPRTTGLSSWASQAPTQDHRGASSETVRRRTWRSTDRRFRCGPCRPRRRRS